MICDTGKMTNSFLLNMFKLIDNGAAVTIGRTDNNEDLKELLESDDVPPCYAVVVTKGSLLFIRYLLVQQTLQLRVLDCVSNFIERSISEAAQANWQIKPEEHEYEPFT